MAPRKTPNDYTLFQGCAYLQLTDKKGFPTGQAVVDIQDLTEVLQHRWHLAGHNVATDVRRPDGSKHTLALHRLIANTYLPHSPHVDHKDGDILNNRRSNLRSATASQNSMNRHVSCSKTGYKGVHACSNGFVARIGYKGTRVYLGFYGTSDEAAKAYNVAAEELFGEFACLNVIRL